MAMRKPKLVWNTAFEVGYEPNNITQFPATLDENLTSTRVLTFIPSHKGVLAANCFVGQCHRGRKIIVFPKIRIEYCHNVENSENCPFCSSG